MKKSRKTYNKQLKKEKNLPFQSGRVCLERMEFLCPQCPTNLTGFSLLQGGLTECIISMLTSPVWASHRPALTYTDTNSRLSMCTSHGFHMKRYRCYSQLRTPGITFYPGKLTQPNKSFHPGSAPKASQPFIFGVFITLLVPYNAQFGTVVSIYSQSIMFGTSTWPG